ncbi:MAG: hypothetical protein EA368_16180 [Leptolyngbya sp. DLM2.Bin27]|nr:MAG: hypothetical protein EA368_16180 [Leptolyngbya sp. DLM2.Bin27]
MLFPYFIEHIDTSLVAIAAVLASRAVAIFGFSALSGLLTRNPIPWAAQTVLWWVGLRGSVAIALALSLPDAIGDRQQIISNSFGVVLFTLLVQGLTTKPLLDALHLLETDPTQTQYRELLAQRSALTQVLTHLAAGELPAPGEGQPEQAAIKAQLEAVDAALRLLQQSHPQIADLIRQQHREDLVAIETTAYTRFLQDGWLKTPPASVVTPALDALSPPPTSPQQPP